ncbi:hypothetical protein P3H15_42225 [Rhodococcus sp. T2V]|uniref:hypothetical protein n=1 Tax=Rhodococcus sp. T2V TaxID=3034164 RepID=UPI0023E2CF35|nr:hypothetical protein [Rhodococcus sp. T2V]MDF3311599.1 hypothetical protein [Rhodococcus sp. T2V]
MCACTPAPSSERWPASGSTPKAADSPAFEQRENPQSPDADRDTGPLDTRYEQLRHAALHERARAFPLGLGVLVGRGITAWRWALTRLTCDRTPARGPLAVPEPPRFSGDVRT